MALPFRHFFFMGIAGSGMSALAQFLNGMGLEVSGSDRFFKAGEYNETREKLEAAGIPCHLQDGSGITSSVECVVVSTAIEESVPEMVKARELGLTVWRRSELLARISGEFRTIAVAGTSGKSTTSAMLFDVLRSGGLDPSIISGAGLVGLIREGRIGNAHVGKGDWLVIEADESDGSIVQYHPETGVLLNIDKDHKEVDELLQVFRIFRDNCSSLSVNRSHPLASGLSKDPSCDFAVSTGTGAGYEATGFRQEGLHISFLVNGFPFHLETVGRHNMENALAAATVANRIGVPLETAAEALSRYEGIYRRHQVLGRKRGVWVIDDFAHNPVKVARSIEACQPVAPKVVAWFQPHGYAPTKFLRANFAREISAVLRPQDEVWMSEIFYAGGTAVKDISAADLVADLQALGCNARFVADRNDLAEKVRPFLTGDCVLLLMGARDPSLEAFARQVWEDL